MREDFKDAPEWITGLLTPLNSFMSSVYYALDKDITFQENISAAIKEIKFTTRSDYSSADPKTDGWVIQQVYNPLRIKPSGVHIVRVIDLTAYSVVTDPVTLFWDYLDGYIKIKYVTGLADSNKYQLNLLIF